MNLDRTERRVVAEKLNDFGSWGTHAQHELWRISHVHKKALTEKELNHVRKTEELLKEVLERTRLIKERCR